MSGTSVSQRCAHVSLSCLLISTQAGSALSKRDVKTSLLTPSPPPGICLFLLLSLIFWKVVHPGCSTSLPHPSALKSESCLCRLLKPPILDCFLSATLDCGPLSPRPVLSPQSCDASWAAASSSPSRALVSLPFFHVPWGSVLGPLFLRFSTLPMGDHMHSGGFVYHLSAHGLQPSPSAQNSLLRARLINPDSSWTLIHSFNKLFLEDSWLPDTVVNAGYRVVNETDE